MTQEASGSFQDQPSPTSSFSIQGDEGSWSPKDSPTVSMGFDAQMMEVTIELFMGKEVEAPKVTLIMKVAGVQIQMPKMVSKEGVGA